MFENELLPNLLFVKNNLNIVLNRGLLCKFLTIETVVYLTFCKFSVLAGSLPIWSLGGVTVSATAGSF